METSDIVYTTAGGEYDYPYVSVDSDNVGTASNGKAIRRVRMPHSRAPFQTARYCSGFHLVIDQVGFDKQVAYGIIKVREEDNSAFDALLAVFDEMDEREAKPERVRLRELGASAFLTVDISDADQHWVQHACTSDDSGHCASCKAYVAAGGVL